MLETLHPFALSLIIGLLIGVEREYHHKGVEQTLGVRTIPLVALSGTLAAWLQNAALAAVIGFAAFTLIALGYWRSTRRRSRMTDYGLTTEIATIVVFCMGYVMLTDTALGGVIGLGTLVLLISRGWLHKFVRQKLRRSELTAAVTLIIAIFGIAPYLPDRTIDPLKIFNPRRLLILFSLVGLLQFSGYAIIRIFGARTGLALSGFLGGFVSSTAVFVSLADTLKKYPQQGRSVMASGLLAVSGTIIELGIILAISSLPLLQTLVLFLGAIIVLSSGLSAALLFRQKSQLHSREIGDPLNFVSILRLGALLAGLIAAVDLVYRSLHNSGLWLVAAVSGLFELHGVSIAVAVDYKKGSLDTEAAQIAIMVAVAASFVSKIVILFFSGQKVFAVKLSLLLATILMAAVGISVLH